MQGQILLTPKPYDFNYALLDLESKKISWSSYPRRKKGEFFFEDYNSRLYDGSISRKTKHILVLFYRDGKEYLFWGEEYIEVDSTLRAEWKKFFFFRTLKIYRNDALIYRKTYLRELLVSSFIFALMMLESWNTVDHNGMECLVFQQLNNPDLQDIFKSLHARFEEERKGRQKEQLGTASSPS